MNFESIMFFVCLAYAMGYNVYVIAAHLNGWIS